MDLQKVKEAINGILWLIYNDQLVEKEGSICGPILVNKLRDARAELENPANDDCLTKEAAKIFDAIEQHGGRPYIDDEFKFMARKELFSSLCTFIEQYTESYAARQCATCSKLKNALVSHTRDRDAEIETIAEKE